MKGSEEEFPSARAAEDRLGRLRCVYEVIPSVLCGESDNEQAWEGEGSSQTILLARRGRTIGMCSLDARSEGQSGCSLLGGK